MGGLGFNIGVIVSLPGWCGHLATAGAFLLTGGRGVLLGWDRTVLANSSQVKEPDWALEVPGGAEVNSMLVLAEGGTQGRQVLEKGDNKVYNVDSTYWILRPGDW